MYQKIIYDVTNLVRCGVSASCKLAGVFAAPSYSGCVSPCPPCDPRCCPRSDSIHRCCTGKKLKFNLIIERIKSMDNFLTQYVVVSKILQRIFF